ncbi:MAG TPA: hypothetical protein ENJ82_17975, partial [Bacteroidetes bacterium]|nr:hypothetical protein [Bacteroidota bacterium]
MIIHQYIYTRLPKAHSAQGKDGFQAAFVPPNFLTAAELLALESRIHFPTNPTFSEKWLAFFQEIEHQQYLVLFFLKSLPLEKDSLGREGNFLCQGFFLPEKCWQIYPSPLALLPFLEGQCLHSLQAVLASPKTFPETGIIAPLAVKMADLPKPPHEMGGLEPHVVSLWRALRGLNEKSGTGFSLVLKGPALAVTRALAGAHALLPAAQRPGLGWDSAFDGGRIHFSPFRVFGYAQNAPQTGRPIGLDLANGQWNWGDVPPDFVAATPLDLWMEHQWSPTYTWQSWYSLTELAAKLKLP